MLFPTVLVLATVAAAASTGTQVFAMASRGVGKDIQYTFEPVFGYFAHDNTTSPGDLGPTPPRFGLLDDSRNRWRTFFKDLDELNCQDKRTSYKLFMLGRHGEGFHNLAERLYGHEAWEEHWSLVNGDGNMTWGPDAELTDTGKQQAEAARELYNFEFRHARLPVPDHFYTSPLSRAMSTHDITFRDLEERNRKPKTLVVENCREHNGEHTCDKRRTLTYIRTTYPHLRIDEGMTEEDELWDPDVRENEEQLVARARTVIEKAFLETREKDTFISITAHSGFIRGFVKAGGKPDGYSLPTGGILPMVIKATKSYNTA